MMKKVILSLMIIALSGCGTTPEKKSATTAPAAGGSRYSVDQDFSPDVLLNPDLIEDAIPREEYVTKAGNKSPYTVLGKTYTVLPSSRGYRGEGQASWYGLKFHGHKTSNGETYDIYEMTAAHKTLPIPCYVKVTNKDNGKSAIVRVNDRGPFHEGRIIDLSYAAATKLGFIGKGTANVVVEAIDVREWQANSTYTAIAPVSLGEEIIETTSTVPGPAPVAASYSQPVAAPAVASQPLMEVQPGYILLQVGAYLEEAMAHSVQKKLAVTYANAVSIESGRDRYHRVRIGPVAETDVDRIISHLMGQGFPRPMRIR